MSKDFFIRLSFAVYKVTELFPKEEALRDDIRNLANEILADLLYDNQNSVLYNIERISELFSAAENKELVDSRNFLVLSREYKKVAKYIQNKQRISTGKTVENSSKRKNRKNEILEIIKENGKVKVGDLLKTFPDTNRRTLLRDLDNFCHAGLVQKNGNGRGACYIIKNATL